MAYQEGNQSLASGATSASVTFPIAFENTPGLVIPVVSNYVDGSVLNILATVTARTASGFTVDLSQATDSANYKLEWVAGNATLLFQTVRTVGKSFLDLPVLTAPPADSDRFPVMVMAPTPRMTTLPWSIIKNLFMRINAGAPSSENLPAAVLGDTLINSTTMSVFDGTQWRTLTFNGAPTPTNIDWTGRRVLYVSKGAAATDTRGSLSKYDYSRPFATPTAAQTAAASGDIIVVEPGSYQISSALGKAGVNWHFEQGAAILSQAGVSIWTGVTGGYKVCGRGRFSCESGAGGKVIDIAAAGQYYIVGEFYADVSASLMFVNHADAVVTLDATGVATAVDEIGSVELGSVVMKGDYSLGVGAVTGLLVKGKLELCGKLTTLGNHSSIIVYDGSELRLKSAVIICAHAGSSSLQKSGAGTVNIRVFTAFANRAVHSSVIALINPVVVSTDVS